MMPKLVEINLPINVVNMTTQFICSMKLSLAYFEIFVSVGERKFISDRNVFSKVVSHVFSPVDITGPYKLHSSPCQHR